MSDLPTIYVFCNQKGCDGRGDWHSMMAVAEDGTALAGHICSHHSWARHDMGIDENGWKRDIYAKHYPQGFQVKWIEGVEIDAVIAALPAEKTTSPHAEFPRVEVTLTESEPKSGEA